MGALVSSDPADYDEAKTIFSNALSYENYIEDKDTLGIIYKFMAYYSEEKDKKEAIDYYTLIMNDASDKEVKEILGEIINQEKNHYRYKRYQ